MCRLCQNSSHVTLEQSLYRSHGVFLIVLTVLVHCPRQSVFISWIEFAIAAILFLKCRFICHFLFHYVLSGGVLEQFRHSSEQRKYACHWCFHSSKNPPIQNEHWRTAFSPEHPYTLFRLWKNPYYLPYCKCCVNCMLEITILSVIDSSKLVQTSCCVWPSNCVYRSCSTVCQTDQVPSCSQHLDWRSRI